MSLLLRRRMLMSVDTEINLLEGYADQHITITDYYYEPFYPNVTLEPNTTYTFSFDYEFIFREGNSEVRVDLFYRTSTNANMTRIRGFVFPNYEKGTMSFSFKTKEELGNTNYLAFRIPASDTRQTIEMYARNFKLVKE